VCLPAKEGGPFGTGRGFSQPPKEGVNLVLREMVRVRGRHCGEERVYKLVDRELAKKEQPPAIDQKKEEGETAGPTD